MINNFEKNKLPIIHKKRFNSVINTKNRNKVTKKNTIFTYVFSIKKKLKLKPLFYYYDVEKGNNPEIIKKVMETRKQWKLKDTISKNCHFIWRPINKNIIWEKYNKFINKNINSTNHYEFSFEIGRKDKLPKNLRNYFLNKKYDLFKIIPPTIEIYLDQDYSKEINLFKEIFKKFEKYKNKDDYKYIDLSEEFENNKGKCSIEISYFGGFEKINKSFYNNENLWLIKPTNLNRGNGISIFNNLKDLNLLLKNYTSDNKNNRIKIIIQKYCERPLLIYYRKFDIRIWGLLTQNKDFYLAREGYIRTSSHKHKEFDKNNKKNLQIYLTNIAIQKLNKESFGVFEEGNIMSFKDFKVYLENNYKEISFKKIYKQIKFISKNVFQSVKNKINKNNRNNCFEIFGFDYLVDNNGNVFLIEVNTNPSLEESSKWLTQLFSRLIDDAFKLTIDKIFVLNKPNKNSNFEILNYNNTDLLWDLLIKDL